MQEDFNESIYQEKKKQRKYLLLFLLFVLGAYASIQSVISFGKTETDPLALGDTTVIEQNLEPIQQVLGDQEFGPEWQVSGVPADTYGLFGTAPYTDTKEKDYDLSGKDLAIQEPVVEEIPLVEEEYDPCADVIVAAATGFDVGQCLVDLDNENLPVDENTDNQNNNQGFISGGGGGSNSGGSSNGGGNGGNESVDPEGNQYTTSTDSTLLSWVVGGQEIIGLPGSEPATSQGWLSSLPGVALMVDDIDNFIGTQITTNSDKISRGILYIFRGYWIPYDILYPGSEEVLDSLSFEANDVLALGITAEDGQTNSWYKVKIYVDEPRLSSDYLIDFEVNGQSVLGLPGLKMQYPSMNMIDFGANLEILDFETAQGITIELDNIENLEKAVLYTWNDYWVPWSLLYPGTDELLAEMDLHAGEVMILWLEDISGNKYLYRLNLLQGDTLVEQSSELGSDNTLQYFAVGNQNVLDLPGVEVESATSTGAILEVEDFDNFKGVQAFANDRENADVEVLIYRDGVWTTWKYDLGLDIVGREPLLPNDVIVIRVTAENGEQKLYKVTVTYQAIVYSADNTLTSLTIANNDFVKLAGLYLGKELDLSKPAQVKLFGNYDLSQVKVATTDQQAQVELLVYRADKQVYPENQEQLKPMISEAKYQFVNQDTLVVKVTAENGEQAFYALQINLIKPSFGGGSVSPVKLIKEVKKVEKESVKVEPLELKPEAKVEVKVEKPAEVKPVEIKAIEEKIEISE
ncbi:hypothetical protein H6761_01850 [Candidatus Nomurabacteria bacterium]|nr:hypothetical protein [Candidatus Nomurabacteria bacterium]